MPHGVGFSLVCMANLSLPDLRTSSDWFCLETWIVGCAVSLSIVLLRLDSLCQGYLKAVLQVVLMLLTSHACPNVRQGKLRPSLPTGPMRATSDHSAFLHVALILFSFLVNKPYTQSNITCLHMGSQHFVHAVLLAGVLGNDLHVLGYAGTSMRQMVALLNLDMGAVCIVMTSCAVVEPQLISPS